MISYLIWKIIDLSYNDITLLTLSWIWYNVHINELTYNKLSQDQDTSFFIYHSITENSQNLFGFLNKDEKKIFEELIKISWIWWKIAMQILTIWIDTLLESIGIWDNKKIESIKWVWKKMAEKIILEMKDKDFWIAIWRKNTKIIGFNKKIDENLSNSIKNTLCAMWYNIKHIENALSEVPDWINWAKEMIEYIIKRL